mgnify:CR=1 FL=1
MDDAKEYLYLTLFFIGILLASLFIRDNSRRIRAVRDLHYELEQRIISLTERSTSLEESISGLHERVESSIDRFRDIEAGIIDTEPGANRVLEEARSALDLIREIRERQ